MGVVTSGHLPLPSRRLSPRAAMPARSTRLPARN